MILSIAVSVFIISSTLYATLTQDSIMLLYLPVLVIGIFALLMFYKRINVIVVIFSIAISLMFQTTLISKYLMGSDIIIEHWIADITLFTGFWNPSIDEAVNSSAGMTVLAPIYSLVLNIDIIWVFKIIFPMFYALTPICLYLLSSKFIGKKLAAVASMLYIFVPTFLLEMPTSVKQQIAIFMIALIFLLIFDRRIASRYTKVFLIVILSIVTVSIHYTAGLFILLFLGGAFIIWFLFIFGFEHTFMTDSVFEGRYLSLFNLFVICFVLFIFAVIYLSVVADGVLLKSLYVMITEQVSRISHLDMSKYVPVWEVKGGWRADSVWQDVPNANISDVIKAGFGLDFLSVPFFAKMFRISFWVVNILAIVGFLYSIFVRRRFANFYILILGVVAIAAGAYIILPVVNSYMGVTRVYHIVILFFAPIVAYGGYFVFRCRWKIFMFIILSIYFLFTSGFMFEILQYNNTDILDMPYSVAISGNRLDMGIFSDNDYKAAEYTRNILRKDESSFVTGDFYSGVIIGQVVRWKYGWEWFDKRRDIVYDVSQISNDSFIFLREINVKNREVALYSGYGQRKIVSFDEIGFDEVLEGRELFFDNGARVYAPKGGWYVVDK